MKTAIVNLGTIVSGDLRAPVVAGDSIIMADGLIVSVGTASAAAVDACDVVIESKLRGWVEASRDGFGKHRMDENGPR
ncbi:hypothetical protein FIU28_06370 [Tardiphaga sp. vice154]|uniref:hypothetical protein n=1 Tax=Tardiphaga sp. vice154 TaxID=2592814 RepID=UPI0011624037|nr:hypothetical protein [Tardiphaga sp. vice154]QDM20792.1 hypothetical protein FIU28_06370 [Tardiphaga sp. vice154]